MFNKKLLMQHMQNHPKHIEEQMMGDPNEAKYGGYGRVNPARAGEDYRPSGRSKAYVIQNPHTGEHHYSQLPGKSFTEDGEHKRGVPVEGKGPNGMMHVVLPKGYKMNDKVHPDHEPKD